jgi:chromosome segregation ATPase
MSADNYYFVRKHEGQYAVTCESASDERPGEVRAGARLFGSLEAAEEYADGEWSEYGTVYSDEIVRELGATAASTSLGALREAKAADQATMESLVNDLDQFNRAQKAEAELALERAAHAETRGELENAGTRDQRNQEYAAAQMMALKEERDEWFAKFANQRSEAERLMMELAAERHRLERAEEALAKLPKTADHQIITPSNGPLSDGSDTEWYPVWDVDSGHYASSDYDESARRPVGCLYSSREAALAAKAEGAKR